MLTLLFNIDTSLLELISKGVIGLSTFLSLAAFYLIWQEQKKPAIRTEMMKLIKLFLSYNLASVVIVGLFTLPTVQKNKELTGTLNEVHHVQQSIQNEDIHQFRTLDSLSSITALLQDSISQILIKNNLTKEKTNAIAELPLQVSQMEKNVENLTSDAVLASGHKEGLDSMVATVESIKAIIEKGKNQTLNPQEKSALIKKANDVKYKIFQFKTTQTQNNKKMLLKKLEMLTDSKSKN